MNLENLNLQPLNVEELVDIDGGRGASTGKDNDMTKIFQGIAEGVEMVGDFFGDVIGGGPGDDAYYP